MTSRAIPCFLRTAILFALACILVPAVLSGCQSRRQTTEPSPAPVAERRVSALGRIQPETYIRKVAVPASLTSDRIEDILVKEDQIVTKGQPLAKLNSFESLKAAYDEAAEQVTVAQSKVDQVKAGAKIGEIKAQKYKIESLRRQLAAERKTQDEKVERCRYQMEESKRQYQRHKQLFEEGAVSASEADRYLVSSQTSEKNYAEAVETRTGRLRTLEAQIESEIETLDKIEEVRPVDVNVAQSELRKAIAARNRAEKELGFATVRAPQDGRILKITARPGDRVGLEGILDMADTSKMIVIAEVYQTDMPEIYIGQNASISADGFERTGKATVYELGTEVKKQTIYEGQAGENQDLRVMEVKLRPDPKEMDQKMQHASNLQVNVVFEPKPKTSQ